MTSQAAGPASPSSDDFKEAAARFAAGVTVVTTGTMEEPHGVTVSAFCSLSLAPPQVLVCLTNTGHALSVIRETGQFSVNILARDQQHLSHHFASPDRGAAAESEIQWEEGHKGRPRLAGALSIFECRVAALNESGDHTIVIGDVEAVKTSAGDPDPLLFFHRTYGTLAPMESR